MAKYNSRGMKFTYDDPANEKEDDEKAAKNRVLEKMAIAFEPSPDLNNDLATEEEKKKKKKEDAEINPKLPRNQ